MPTEADLRRVVEQMKRATHREFVTTAPVYSTTEGEAYARHVPHTAEIMSDPLHPRLLRVDGLYVAVVLTVDAFEGSPQWHLSMSLVTATGLGRVPEALALRLATVFFSEWVEGPPEGAFKDVRHFRSRYEAP